MIIGIPVYQGVDLLDVAGPAEMFDWAGFEIDLLAENPGAIAFRTNGFVCNATLDFAQARTYDAIWVPGGDPTALAAIIADPAHAYLGFLKAQADRVKWMCSVCDGAMLLAAAGLLDDRYATTHWQFLNCFPLLAPKVKVAPDHPRYVEDGNRMTGGGISSGLDEALRLIELLGGGALAKRVQQATQYYPRPPVHSAIPSAPACPIPLHKHRRPGEAKPA